MRLGALFLSLLAVNSALPLAAQARQPMPWGTAPALAWRVGLGTGDEPLDPPPAARGGPFTIKISLDGTLRLLGPKGLRHLRLGLPGRPMRAWRDAGIPLNLADGVWHFLADTPLAAGFQALPWGAEDFRPALQGVMWILDDGERYLTMVHPATARVVYLPLPTGQDFSLRMTPAYLELVELPGEGGAPRRWSLPWLALLPQFARLAKPEEIAAPGTALQPFPKN